MTLAILPVLQVCLHPLIVGVPVSILGSVVALGECQYVNWPRNVVDLGGDVSAPCRVIVWVGKVCFGCSEDGDRKC